MFKTILCSFAPVVIVLKILLNQQGLDKPFSGGLGSYKLYVLVASHVSCCGNLRDFVLSLFKSLGLILDAIVTD